MSNNNAESSSSSCVDETEDLTRCASSPQLNFLLQEYIDSMNFFLLTVVKYMSRNINDNCITSPFTAQTLLFLLKFGAGKHAAYEISSNLGYSGCDEEHLFPVIRKILSSLKDEPHYTAKVINQIYVSNDYTILNSFKKTAKYFNTHVENVDFTDIPDNHKLRRYFDCRSYFGSFSRAAVISELSFKAHWEADFVPIQQKKGFYRLDEQVVAVPFMVSRWEYSYCEDKELQARLIEVKFKGRNASMIIVLPLFGLEFLKKVEQRIDQTFVLNLNNLKTRLIDLEMPTFRASTMFNYGQVFKTADIRRIFTEGYAEFSGMARHKSKRDENDLYINEFFQRINFECNEEGVEIGPFVNTPRQSNGTHDYLQTHPLNIVINRPFIFLIKIKGLVIFIGKVTDPTGCYPDRGGPVRRD